MLQTETTAHRDSRKIEEDLRRIGADLGTGAGADTSFISFAGLVDFAPDLLNLVCELASAVAIFLLVRFWLRRATDAKMSIFLRSFPTKHRGWICGLLAASVAARP